MKRVVIAVAVVAAIVATAWLVFGPASPGPAIRTVPGQDPEFELLTIVGEAAEVARERPGLWQEARDSIIVGALSPERAEELSTLMTLPYLQGSSRATTSFNVTVFDPEAAYGGVNVYNSGHAPEAFITDMAGRQLHRWRFDIADVWPEVPATVHGEFWRRVHPYPNGDLLAVFEGIGIIKIDRDSNLLWALRCGAHHEAFIAEDGRIYVLTRRGRLVPRIHRGKPILEDAVSIVSADGELLEEHSLLEIMERSGEFSRLWAGSSGADLFHTNSIYVFDGSLAAANPLFAKGHVLVSMLKIGVLAIIDLEAERVTWAGIARRSGGFWSLQHDPQPLDNGNLLLFDNQGYRRKSRAVEFDPGTLAIKWQYAGTPDDPLYSMKCGASTRLPNGNTLITESDAGRAVEVTRDGTVVWEFHNPHRAGENDELVATLFEVERYDADYFDWLPQE